MRFYYFFFREVFISCKFKKNHFIKFAFKILVGVLLKIKQPYTATALQSYDLNSTKLANLFVTTLRSR